MNFSPPNVPIPSTRIERAHALIRRQAETLSPSGNPLTDEIRREIANGRIRGRDLLQADTYREHLQDRAAKLVDHYRQLSAEARAALLSTVEQEEARSKEDSSHSSPPHKDFDR
ncbi:hypothetical protein GCM10027280_12350 [Micromonospora polyrhachis]|uniref:Uncharacterized protein n=1 Tax=Micromonospora polyrhachis TaxID=1282883 RepID=A0A7W7SUI8_9ACTN|nr:hypothetical protein [Micromonospora polyrhachis]MBB4959970.1 hypothetical protein [Micromonospora polyrhachis]